MITRRDILKLSALGLSSLAFNPFGEPQDEYHTPTLPVARVAVDRVAAIYREPEEHSWVVRWTRRDELLNIYYSVTPASGPPYNPIWYRVFGGYIHSAHLQKVRFRHNTPLDSIPENGQLAEVTLPYSQAYKYSQQDGWQPQYRLYYETTHWITAIDQGPDGRPWYQLTSEIDDYLQYYVPASHLRPISDDEIAPISPDVPYAEKRIEVNLTTQSLTCFEGNQPVFGARISSGAGSNPVPEGFQTPRGEFHITSKMPSKHMGAITASGAPDGYILPGVPWTCFFIFDTGVAFHGTFWHSNFGLPMSHGCINMRNEDAKWLFRWVTPTFETPVQDRRWDARGYGTRVIIE